MRNFFTKYYYFDQNNEDKTDVTSNTDKEMRNRQKKLIGKGKEITDLGVLDTGGNKIYEYILQHQHILYIYIYIYIYMCVCVWART
jgi:hypothetical protein